MTTTEQQEVEAIKQTIQIATLGTLAVKGFNRSLVQHQLDLLLTYSEAFANKVHSNPGTISLKQIANKVANIILGVH